MFDTIAKLANATAGNGKIRLYAKLLSPNDNSKNQVYLGGGFAALNILPHAEVEVDLTNQAGSIRDRAKARMDFWWLTNDGISNAPHAQLILYPKYPEIRMSGFLKGCKSAPSNVMASRDEGRVLFFGIGPDGQIIGHAVFADHPLAKELAEIDNIVQNGIFIDLTGILSGLGDTKVQLLSTLKRIHKMGWIESQKLNKDGRSQAYAALNGGGYTLEAELGVSPNGYAEPDFLGWEVKQYGVVDFEKFRAKSPITLMTPEPDGGIYKNEGLEVFMRKFGYPDKSGKPNRLNFGGVYKCKKNFHNDTGLKLRLDGYDENTKRISNMDGAVVLLDRKDTIAASWSFSGLMKHWNRKHAQAVYVPSLSKKPPAYCYGPVVQLCEETDFLLFLNALADETVYLDPAAKIEHMDSQKPKSKKRSQFRIRELDLNRVYNNHERTTL